MPAAGLALVSCAAVALVAALVSLKGDVAALAAQAKKSAKTVKTIKLELAEVDAGLRALTPPPAAATAVAALPVAEMQQVKPVTYRVPARPAKVETEFPKGSVCYFRPGDVQGLMNCIDSAKKT